MSFPAKPTLDGFLADQRGMTLVFTLMLMGSLLLLTIGGMVVASTDLRISRNVKNGAQAVFAAESGILHARGAIEDELVSSFSEDVLPHWADLLGTATIAIPGYSDVGYAVTPSAYGAQPDDRMWITSAGNGPEGSKRNIQALLELGGVLAPGAIYLAADGVETTFNGNNFLIDGNDVNLDGTATGDQVAGIAATDQDNADTVSGTLPSGREDNVIGLGGDASIHAYDGTLTADQIANEIVPEILAQPGVVTDPPLNGGDVFGTVDVPQVTHFSGDVTLNGGVSGAGILVVEGSMTISGNMEYVGLAIVLGETKITSLTGNATFLGALWTLSLDVNVSGSLSLTYSNEALEVADETGTGGTLPRLVNIVSWREY